MHIAYKWMNTFATLRVACIGPFAAAAAAPFPSCACGTKTRPKKLHSSSSWLEMRARHVEAGPPDEGLGQDHLHLSLIPFLDTGRRAEQSRDECLLSGQVKFKSKSISGRIQRECRCDQAWKHLLHYEGCPKGKLAGIVPLW